MHFDTRSLDTSSVYKLLTGIVVPRPIAWVLSRNQNGLLNLAPFSFFNCVGTDPALVILSVGNHPDRPKDTATNIEEQGSFVVNLVDEAHSQAMSDSATDFPESISEVNELGLETVASTLIDVPRLAHVPAALECKLHSIQLIGNNRLILGHVLGIFLRDEFVTDATRLHVLSQKMHLIGRMGGAGGYTRTTDTFEITRKKYREVE
jgi:flavin reductase (DIM6/NTAB) family NADH-FMN oxidoreductase RutF